MDSFAFWKKLNTVIKAKEPMDKALAMVSSGEITKEELSWALVVLATMPIAMLDAIGQKNG